MIRLDLKRGINKALLFSFFSISNSSSLIEKYLDIILKGFVKVIL